MCTRPNYALYIKNQDPNEKGYLKFINLHPEDNYRSLKAKYGENLLSLPCGQCEECKKDYSKTWAIRCALEAAKYTNNWFITLTYDNAHYRNLNKDDIREFLDNLSQKKAKEFKYWLAGEYGPKTGRAHYHMILINYDIKPKPITKSEYGNTIYESEIINKAWGKGYCEIQEAGNNAMAYCAKYASKSGKEFNFKPMMSKGLGLEALKENQEFINKYGYIQGQNGQFYKIPRYYFKKITTPEAAELKEKQIQKAKRKTAEMARNNHLELTLIENEKIAESRKKGRAKI